MTQIIEGRYDENSKASSEQLEQAVDRIVNGYRRAVEVPAQTAILEAREGIDLLESLFTPETDAEKAVQARMAQEARGRGYVRHEGEDGYTYIQTPEGSVMFAADGTTIVRLN